MLAAPELPAVSYVMSYFYFRALAITGLYDKSFPLWSLWKDQVSLHLTTWMEDMVSKRSDCHAWGAVPLSEFTGHILGVRSIAPGYAKVWIEPSLGHLTWAEGKVAIPGGEIEVSWNLSSNGVFHLKYHSEQFLDVTFKLPDGTLHHYIHTGTIQLECKTNHL